LRLVSLVSNVHSRNYITKGFKNASVGALGAIINWILLFMLTQRFGIWYIWSEIIATFFAWFFNYNFNILLKVIDLENEPQD
jgi:putative flippase GtrA